MMCPWASNMKKKIFFCILTINEEESDPELDPDLDPFVRGTYGSGDPDPHQNVTDPQHGSQV